MKPAAFEYFAPKTVDETLALLARHGDEAKLLAGGQSLVPAMNFRLAQPAILIDLNRVEELFYIQNSDEEVRLGAMTRQTTIERSPLVQQQLPLLAEAMPYIAHSQIRNRGTIGGSLAHADPAAELPAVMLALGANFKLRSVSQERWVGAEEFFLGLFATALEPEELLVEVALPPRPERCGWAFQEVARRHGDYALAGVAARTTLNEDGRCESARLIFFSVGETPIASQQVSSRLDGETPTESAIREAAAAAAAEDIDPTSDIHASADFRRHLAEVLARRALLQACERASKGRPKILPSR